MDQIGEQLKEFSKVLQVIEVPPQPPKSVPSEDMGQVRCAKCKKWRLVKEEKPKAQLAEMGPSSFLN